MVRIFVNGQNSNKSTFDDTIKQKQYGGPPRGWKGEPPLRGSELFINNLPKDATLSELIPFFNGFGRVYCLRLMMNTSGVNRGYCFVKYSSPREAYSVLKKLQGSELRPDHKIYAQISLDNSRLYFGQIPKSVTTKEFKMILETTVPGVKNVYMSQDFTDKSLNRGFAFAEFDSHKEALIAKTKLSKVGLKINAQPILVGWSVPEKNSADPNLFPKVRVIHIDNIMEHTTESDLRLCIGKFVDDLSITRIKKVCKTAFVHFTKREFAQKALKHLSGYILDGSPLSVRWARPIFNTKYYKKPALLKKEIDKDLKKEDVPEKQDATQQPKDQSPSSFIHSILPTHCIFGCCAISWRFGQCIPLIPVKTINSPFYKEMMSAAKEKALSQIQCIRPSVVLKNLSMAYGWGDIHYCTVMYIVWWAKGPFYESMVIIRNRGLTVTYPDITHPPSENIQDAQDLVAYAFMKAFFFSPNLRW